MISGFLYEQEQRVRDRERFPQIGRYVEIGGGRALNIYCSGAGQPTVVLAMGAPWQFYKPRAAFENGAPRPGYAWVWIQRELAKTTASCWYDRAGSGWSDLGPYPRDSAAQARDLHALLQRAGVAPPYVLVAESSAALDAHVYTGLYPSDVAGLVFVNGVHPDFLVDTRSGTKRLAPLPGLVGHSQDAMAQVFNQVGFYRLGMPERPAPATPPKGLTSAEWNTIWRLTQSSKARSALMQEIGSWPQSSEEARKAGSLGDRPLIALSSENTVMAADHQRVWMQLQTELASLSVRGRHELIKQDAVDSIYQAPGVVVEAVRQVIGDVRRLPVGQHTF